MEPTAKPGFFIGWKLESGLRYRGILRILDYDMVVKGKKIAFRLFRTFLRPKSIFHWT